jgi:Flp pilus assembly pilin Flp
MIHLANLAQALRADRRAVSALEYGLIAGLIVATIAIGFTSHANASSDQFVTIGDNL